MERDELNGVELRHLRALVAIAETSSFARAGERLGYAQSAVSQQIGALERAVATQLVERPGGPRPVSLTEAGTILVEHARVILARVGAARDDLDALRSGETGTVRIGTFQSAGARLLPAILHAFRAAHPGVTVELVENHSDVFLLGQVSSGDLDGAFAIEVPGVEGFDCQHLVDDPYLVLAPPGSPFAGRSSIRLHELAGHDVVGWQSCPNGRLIEKHLERGGTEPNVVFRTDDNLTLQRLVGAGLGHAVMTELCIEREATHPGSATVIGIADDLAPRRIGIYWRRARRPTPALRAFIETARIVGDEIPIAA